MVLVEVDLWGLLQEQWKGQTCASCQRVGTAIGRFIDSGYEGEFEIEVGPFCRALVNVWCEMCLLMSRLLLEIRAHTNAYTYYRALESLIDISFNRFQGHTFMISIIYDIGFLSSIELLPPQASSTENTVYARLVCDLHIDIELIRHWIYCCDSWHEGSCHSGHTTEKASDNSSLKSPVRLIDVDLECLVIPSSSCRYIALSYVWGLGRSLTLKSEVRVF